MDKTKLLFVGVAAIIFCAGYYFGNNDKELENAYHQISKITAELEVERQKQNELVNLNAGLSSDVDRLNRLLKSEAKKPRDLQSCIAERDRLRSLVKDAGILVVECRKGLGWCDTRNP